MTHTSENVALSFGDRLRHGQLDAWHLGLLLATYNAGLMLAMAVLALASAALFPLWIYLLIAAPVLFSLFWLWFSQNLLSFYHRFSLHDTLLIAKASILPFVVLMLLAAIGLSATMQSPASDSGLATTLYYCLIFSVGSIFLGLTVVSFGLRHRIRVAAVPEPKPGPKKRK